MFLCALKRNVKGETKMKKAVLIFTICLSVFLVACGPIDVENTNKEEMPSETNISENQSEEIEVQEQDVQSSEDVGEIEEAVKFFESDEIVNDFFVKYNEIAECPIDGSEIEKGNIDSKALVYIDDFSMEVINASDFLSVSISVAPENEDTKLLSIFSSCIKAMNSTLTDDEISSAWMEIHETGYLVENYDFNGIKITYVPSKELSWGTSALRIDMSFPLE